MSMRPPGKVEFEMAIAAAGRMRTQDVDPHHVAEVLLYLQERHKDLEALYRANDRYLRFGMPEQELGEMRQLVDRLREREPADRGDDGDVEDTLPL